jgi:hypothetical protein
MQIAATLTDITNLNATVGLISNQLMTTSSAVASLNSQITSRVDLFHGCYQDTASCVVNQHRQTPYWFLCLTPFLSANVTVSAS